MVYGGGPSGRRRGDDGAVAIVPTTGRRRMHTVATLSCSPRVSAAATRIQDRRRQHLRGTSDHRSRPDVASSLSTSHGSPCPVRSGRRRSKLRRVRSPSGAPRVLLLRTRPIRYTCPPGGGADIARRRYRPVRHRHGHGKSPQRAPSGRTFLRMPPPIPMDQRDSTHAWGSKVVVGEPSGREASRARAMPRRASSGVDAEQGDDLLKSGALAQPPGSRGRTTAGDGVA